MAAMTELGLSGNRIGINYTIFGNNDYWLVYYYLILIPIV